MAAVRGLDRASLEYPQVRAGLIRMIYRTFSERQNSIIVEKAIRYGPRGVVGIDIACPRPYERRALSVPRPGPARRPGPQRRLRCDDPRRRGGRRVRDRRDPRGRRLPAARPDRPRNPRSAGPGADEPAAGGRDYARDLPTSNLLTKALPDEDAVREIFRAFKKAGVPFTIATDGPEMMRTHLRDELELLLRIGALDESELRRRESARARKELPTPFGLTLGIRRSADFARRRRAGFGGMAQVLSRRALKITERQREVVELSPRASRTTRSASGSASRRERRRRTATSFARSSASRAGGRFRSPIGF